eukprot:GHVN01002303.1.p1 GENE.GHVN01002303.1~~GHVN01002303.1.p1  ORF type:complete len:116 (-),score=4.17 GHVN01002303.1:275-622(-)
MGLAFSRIWSRLFVKKEMRILMVGLDAAGKTTILYKLKLGEVVTTIPTIGQWVSSVSTVSHSADRIQRGDGRIQEHIVHGLGCWWTRQDSSVMETLLLEHTWPDLRSGLQRSRQN